jgi:hypothetical protein
VRGGGGQRGGQDQAHLCPGLQCYPYSVPAACHSRAYSVGHRPVSCVPGGKAARTFGWGSMLHIWGFFLSWGLVFPVPLRDGTGVVEAEDSPGKRSEGS